MPTKKVVVHGSYFVNNFGDTLLVKLLADRIADYVGRDNVWLATKGLQSEQDSIGYPVLSKGEESGVTHVVYGGGGYLGEPNVGGFRKLKWVIRNYLRHFSWNGRFVNSEFHVLGVGVGPINNVIYRRLVGTFLQRCRTILVRDQESLSYCQKYYGLENINVCVDLALSTPVREKDKSGIAIHLDTASYHVIDEVLAYLKRLPDEHVEKPVKIIFDNDAGSSVANMEKYEASLAKAGYSEGEYEFHVYKGMADLIALLASSELVVTSKLHVGIVTISQQGKVIAIPKHTKTKRLYSQLSLSNFCIEHEAFSVDAFDRAYNSLQDFVPDSRVISNGINLLDENIKRILT